jgi:hypothetical protein
MLRYNALISCDQNYYDKWGINLLSSLKEKSPKLNLHCHIINPTKDNAFNGVDITTETIQFDSTDAQLSYYQASRFLVVANKFQNNELVFTVDADSVCTKKINLIDLETLFSKHYVLQHHKQPRWLAGFVCFNNSNFKNDFAAGLNSLPIAERPVGWDQIILNRLAREYNFVPANNVWMNIGKNKSDAFFLTLKGSQKTKEKYVNTYLENI